MGEEPVGDRDDADETEAKNVTLRKQTFRELEKQYPHALDDPERIRAAIHDALEDGRDADENRE